MDWGRHVRGVLAIITRDTPRLKVREYGQLLKVVRYANSGSLRSIIPNTVCVLRYSGQNLIIRISDRVKLRLSMFESDCNLVTDVVYTTAFANVVFQSSNSYYLNAID
jgi:hypothetical protein